MRSMRHRALACVVVAGCYQPHPANGVPCTPTGHECPGDQQCVDGICGGTPADAQVIDADDAALDAPIDAFSFGWSTPTTVPGVDSTSAEDDPTYTPDRLTIVFASNRNGTYDLFIGKRTSTAMAFTVTPLDALNTTTADELSPEISSDGNTLYFSSDRVTAGEGEIYVSRIAAGTTTFGPPDRDAQLSLAGSDDGDIAIAPNGLTAILVRSGKLMRATRTLVTNPWGTPVTIAGTFGTNPAAPSLDTAGDLYFHAGTQRDLFVARKNGNAFGTPIPITELNTTGRDSGPFISPDEKHLVWARSGKLLESSR